jgi:hypothetical protein
MNTGQTMFSILALSFLSLVTLRYYGSIGQAGLTLSQSNAGLTATTIATSFIERAQNTAFDAVTAHVPANYVLTNTSLLTPYTSFGTDTSTEVAYDDFDDFDDFNNLTIDYHTVTNEIYKVNFMVFYVDTANINTIKYTQTFLKRMDIKVWRTYPPSDSTQPSSFDTLRMSTLFGYFKFNPI